MEAAQNDSLRHPMNSNPSGKNPLSGRRLRAHSGGLRPDGPAPVGAAGLCSSYKCGSRFAALAEEGCSCHLLSLIHISEPTRLALI
eukprot:6152453-Alexandrium_andersonii.AAC.1